MPNRFQPLTREQELKIAQAAEKITEMVDNGEDPTAAVVKAASQENFLPGHVRLLVHAYNNARTSYQREVGESVIDKSARFQLADADEALHRLFPKEPDAKPARKAAAAENGDPEMLLFSLPTGIRDRYDTQMADSEKVEMLRRHWSQPEEKAASQKAVNDDAARRYLFIKRAEDALSNARRFLGEMEVSLKQKQAEAARHLVKSGIHTKVLQRAVQSHLGEAPEIVKRTLGEVPHLAKQGIDLSVVDPNESPLADLLELAALDEEVRQCRQKFASASLELADQRCKHYVTPELGCEPISPVLHGVTKVAAAESPHAKQAFSPLAFLQMQAFQKAWNTVRHPIQTMSGAASNPQNIPTLLSDPGKMLLASEEASASKREEREARKAQSVLEGLSDPEFLNARRRAELQSLMHDLMVNDEVLRTYDPEDVAVAFNELQATVPHIISRPAMLRTLLRKRLASPSADLFELLQTIQATEPSRQEKLTPAVPFSISPAAKLQVATPRGQSNLL